MNYYAQLSDLEKNFETKEKFVKDVIYCVCKIMHGDENTAKDPLLIEMVERTTDSITSPKQLAACIIAVILSDFDSDDLASLSGESDFDKCSDVICTGDASEEDYPWLMKILKNINEFTE